VQIVHHGVSSLAPYRAIDPSGFIFACACGDAEAGDLSAAYFLQFRVTAKIAVGGHVEHLLEKFGDKDG